MINGNPPKPSDHTVLYAIGDIHGRLDLLQDLYEQINHDAVALNADDRTIVHLGDYIDRGPDSKHVIEHFCSQPPEGFDNHWLIGNHEQDMLGFLAGDPMSTRWLFNGGQETLKSYGVVYDGVETTADIVDQVRSGLNANVPTAHRLFLENLVLTYESGDYLFVHAGVRPGIALKDQAPRDLTWIRHQFLNATENFGKIVIHGHSPFRNPQVRRNRIGIDTGAYHTGRLTCLVLHGRTYRFLQTNP